MSDRVLFVSGRCEHSKKILIGIQEIRSTHSIIDTLWRDLIDTWIALCGEHKKPLVRNPDMSYFSPLPFDIEDLDIEEVVRSYMMENTKFEKPKVLGLILTIINKRKLLVFYVELSSNF